MVAMALAMDRAPDVPAAITTTPFETALTAHDLGLRFLEDGDAFTALEHLLSALAAEPLDPAAWNDAGVAWQRLARPDEAALCYERALGLRPGWHEALVNLSFALHQRGAYEEALHAADAAIMVEPSTAAGHWHRALALLSLGRWEDGVAAYEWRLAHPRFARSYPLHRAHPERSWNGRLVPGRTLLVTAEQGLGDTIQFARYLAPLADAGMDVVLECQADLVRLLEGSVPARVVARGNAPVQWDSHCPLLSLLPRVAFPSDRGSGTGFASPLRLSGVAERVRAELFPESPSRIAGAGPVRITGAPRVGVCWKGNTHHSDDAHRSAPVTAFARLGEVPGLEIVNLQRGATSHDLATFPRGIASHEDRLPDLAARAALLATLDLVVTVDTAVAHLACSLGVPCWILLARACDWRWGGVGQSTPWYQSARLFRRGADETWEDVIRRVSLALASRSTGDQGGGYMLSP